MQFGFVKVKILASLVVIVCGEGKERVNIPVVTVKNGHSLDGQAPNLCHRVCVWCVYGGSVGTGPTRSRSDFLSLKCKDFAK